MGVSVNSKTVGEVIVEALLAHGVDTVFGIPGVHTYALTDAMQRAGQGLRFLHTRHEQGAGYMAYGYAKATGQAGVYTVVPGPGVLNAGAALCTAYGAGAPVMCLTANIMSHLIGRGRGQLHELTDQLGLLRGLTKWAGRIDHVGEAGQVMAEAFRQMGSGRQRPVAVEVPWDVMGSSGPAPAVSVREPLRPAVDTDRIAQAVSMIAAAERPMIMVGGGAVDAGVEILELARRLQAPVTAHRSGKGVVPDDSSFALPPVAAYDYWRGCDLLIGIGSRLELQYMRWPWRPPGLKLVRIDIDPTEMLRVEPDIGIVADAEDGVRALNDALALHAPSASRAGALVELKARARRAIEAVQPQLAFLDAIRAALPRDGFFVEEICQAGFTARLGFPVYAPRQYVTCGYQETLGFGYDTALGVKVAHPDKAVVSISGDGGFMFGVQEMATAVQHGIGVVAVVFDNQAFGNVRRDQQQAMDGRLIGADLVNPDLVALARSFGMHGESVRAPEALGKAVASAIDRGEPALIKVEIEPGSETSPWPFLHPRPPEGA